MTKELRCKHRHTIKSHPNCFKDGKVLKEEIFVDDTHKEITELHGDGTVISDRLVKLSEEDMRSPETMIRKHKLNPKYFDLVKVKNSLWHAQKKGVGRELQYSSSITVKPKEFKLDKETIEELFESLQSVDLTFNTPLQYSNNGECLLVPITDLHLGLYATKAVSGSDYDMKIAEKLLSNFITKVKAQVVDRKFEKVILLLGNDFLNSDNLKGTTTRGTEQDTYAFWYEIVDKGLKLISTCINELLEVAPVDVYRVTSNHDLESMYTMMLVIEKEFSGTDGVWVDTSPHARKYVTFGKNLLGFSHNLKIKDAETLMTTEAKKLWAKCEQKYWFLAHLHNQMVYESRGHLEIHRLATFSSNSRWSTDQGYVQGRKKGQMFIFDKKYGMSEQVTIFL